MYRITVVSQALMFLVMAVVLLELLKERRVSSIRHSSPFLWLLSSDVIMLALIATRWLLLEFAVQGKETALTHTLFLVVASLQFVFYYSLLSSFVYFVVDYISQKTSVSFVWAHITVPVSVIFTVLCCASLFTDKIFYIFKDGLVSHGPLYRLSGFGGEFVVLMTVILVIRYHRVLSRGDRVAILSFAVLPLLVQVLPQLREWCSMQVALSLSILCIYCFIHIKQAYLFQKQEVKLAQDKIAIMISQISPHFIFNVLNTVSVLCDKDSKLAKKAIGEFSKYLRANLESLETDRTIPFEKELDYVRYYLNLEKLRFQEDLLVVYDIQANDFFIPPLTLQPLVENAVRHGLLPKKGGGTVRISTLKDCDFYKISVTDDGVGFDVDKTISADKANIGLRNVRERLWGLMGATLEVRSEIGLGSVVTIQISSMGGGET